MIELEVQVLSHAREGLLIEIGRVINAHGFTLQRQRLVQGTHGALLTLVVSGPSRRRSRLESALQEHPRVISVEVTAFEAGEMKPHFAASRALDTRGYVPPPAPPKVEPVVNAEPLPPSGPGALQTEGPVAGPLPEPAEPKPAPAVESEPEMTAEWLMPEPPPPPAPAPPAADPYVEVIPLPPDEPAVEAAMRAIAEQYPQVLPSLLALDRAVAAGARESSLLLAGRRFGDWLRARAQTPIDAPDLPAAIDRMAAPALQGLVDVEVQGSQLHLRQSPLCGEAGRSGCAFFTGLVQAVLEPVVASHEVSIFNVCCRAWGADECVLAVSD